MSDIAFLFPSKWICAADLNGKDVNVQIKQIMAAEEVGKDKETKPVLFFTGMPKGMVMNKTNAKRIAGLYGKETDNWIGKWITLYPSECEFGDETVDCIRIRKVAPTIEPDEPDGEDDLTDEEMAALIKARRKKQKTAASA